MIPFVKASACGNDFLIIEKNAFDGNRNDLTRRLCNRTGGVGADGVEWISIASDDGNGVTARLINADGSDAEISGNGTRCVAAWFISEHPSRRHVVVHTGAGAKFCELVSVSGKTFSFATAMGKARVDPHKTLNIGARVVGIPVDLGNPHFVIVADHLPDDWRDTARKIQALTNEFPHGVNVEFVIVEGRRNMKSFFFERGVGETQSSGTGSCASAAAALRVGLVGDIVEVHAAGGTQTVEFREDEIFLRGEAEIVCRGEAYL